MQIIGGTFGCKVSPVFGFGSGFQEVAVFHKYHIGIEEPGKFLAILGLERVGGSIPFGYNDRGTIEARVRHDNPLAETSFLGMPVVERLGEIGYILLRKLGRFQRLGFRYGGNLT